jgi:hypothetical protein
MTTTTTEALRPSTEYVIQDVYLPRMTGNPRTRGDLRFRTDAQGRVWVQGAGHPEAAAMVNWYATHPRLAVA